VLDNTDCDDTSTSINPEATELDDGIDNDCDGRVDMVVGDINGDGSIGTGEISGDVDEDGVIGSGEIAGDINGDGSIGSGEVVGDVSGDGVIGEGEIDGDANGDGVQNCDDLLILGTELTNEIVQNDLELSAVEAGTYQWIDCSDESPISDATLQDFTPSASGAYAVEITSDGCTVTSACVELIILATEKTIGRVINVYPNPVIGDVTLETDWKFERAEVTVLNLSGQVVWSIREVNTQSLQLPMSEMKQGVYFVRIIERNKSQMIKIIKK